MCRRSEISLWWSDGREIQCWSLGDSWRSRPCGEAVEGDGHFSVTLPWGIQTAGSRSTSVSTVSNKNNIDIFHLQTFSTMPSVWLTALSMVTDSTFCKDTFAKQAKPCSDWFLLKLHSLVPQRSPSHLAVATRSVCLLTSTSVSSCCCNSISVPPYKYQPYLQCTCRLALQYRGLLMDSHIDWQIASVK